MKSQDSTLASGRSVRHRSHAEFTPEQSIPPRERICHGFPRSLSGNLASHTRTARAGTHAHPKTNTLTTKQSDASERRKPALTMLYPDTQQNAARLPCAHWHTHTHTRYTHEARYCVGGEREVETREKNKANVNRTFTAQMNPARFLLCILALLFKQMRTDPEDEERPQGSKFRGNVATDMSATEWYCTMWRGWMLSWVFVFS